MLWAEIRKYRRDIKINCYDGKYSEDEVYVDTRESPGVFCCNLIPPDFQRLPFVLNLLLGKEISRANQYELKITDTQWRVTII